MSTANETGILPVMGGPPAVVSATNSLDPLPTEGTWIIYVVYWIIFGVFAMYFIAHWLFHIWSFANILQISSWTESSSISPWWTAKVFSMYTLFMLALFGFTIAVLQMQSYFRGILRVLDVSWVSDLQRNLLFWTFFSIALLPAALPASLPERRSVHYGRNSHCWSL
jgi:hypothetical protein